MHILVIGGYNEIHKRMQKYVTRITHLTEKELLDSKSKVYFRSIGLNQEEPFDSYIKLARAVNKIDKFDVVISFTDHFQLLACEIALKLGLKYINSKELLLNMKSKYRMRQVLMKSNIKSLNFQLVQTRDIINNRKKIDMGYPYICKPVDQSGSNLIFLIRNSKDIADFIRIASKDNSYPKQFLIEEYYAGKEYSVEAFSINGKHFILGITDKFKNSQFIEIGHCMPAILGNYEKGVITDYVDNVLTVLGMNSGPSHTELIMGDRGPIIVESHARLGGDMIPYLLSHVAHIDVFDLWARVVVGIDPTELIKPLYKENEFIAIWFKFAQERGIVTYESNKVDNEKIMEYSIYKDNNSVVEKTVNSSSRIGHCIALGCTKEDAITAAKIIEKNVIVKPIN